jgi:hypothetical protein
MRLIQNTHICQHYPRQTRHFFTTIHVLLALGLLQSTAHAVERDTSDGITFSITVRTPDQTRAFYTGRGFADAAITELSSKCLLTVGIRNNRTDIVWLEPAKWEFKTVHGVNVARITRDEWDMRWQQLNIPLANQATFGWTQLPESRDLYPGETVGGNLAVEPPAEPFTVSATFATGANKNGTPIKFTTAPLTCSIAAGTLE